MKISTSTHITLLFSDLEKYVRDKKLVRKELVLIKIVNVPERKRLRLEFENSIDTNKPSKEIEMVDKEIFLNTPLEELDITNHTYNFLKGLQIATVKDIFDKMCTGAFISKRNYGKKTAIEIKSIFTEQGIEINERR